MTYDEIKANLSDTIKAMTDKGLVSPSAEFSIGGDIEDSLWLRSKSINNYGFKAFRGEYKFERAFSYINEFETPEMIAAREYMKKVAIAVDFGKDNGIDDKYLDPLRGVNVAMSENLLEK